MSEELNIIGKPKYVGSGLRFHIRFLDKDLFLTQKSFTYLTKLAYRAIVTSTWAYEDASGWLHKEKLDCGDCQTRYIYNLKKEVDCNGIQDTFKIYPEGGLIVSDRNGSYKLNIKPQFISIEYENLLNFPDHEIRKIAAELSVLLKGTIYGKEQD